jgi:adenylosuccinate synthase
MPVDAIVGACWGDEGKGKLTDYLAGEADWVARFQGGRNAGHTIVNPFGRFALHMLPSGVFIPDVGNVLGPGVALDIPALEAELAMLEQAGVPQPRLFVSERCQVVLPIHPLLDRCEETRLAERRFGSTQVGIAPFYADKAMKWGIQVADLFDEAHLRERVADLLTVKNVLLEHLYAQPRIELADVLAALRPQAEFVRRFVTDTDRLLGDAHARGERILAEGQLGALRDPDHGVYPYSTSSSPLAGQACVSLGLGPKTFERVTAVVKAYSSCVGATPFVSELFGHEADTLRERGNEFGATTGRPRRVGWFDAVATRHGCRVQGATEVALTLLDVLDEADAVPICTGYRLDGQVEDHFPPTVRLRKATPVYEQVPGWRESTRDARTPGDLPDAARRYIERIQALIEVPIRFISVGPEREATFEYV